MKENIYYEPFSTFILRTPLFPFNFLEKLLDNQISKNYLRKILNNSKVNEALFIATPSFHSKLLEWLIDDEIESKESSRNLVTLYKYISRMCTRSTPFGLFAGCGIGNVEQNTSIQFKSAKEQQRHTRLDMMYLYKLAKSLSEHDSVKRQLHYYPNSTIYKSGDYLRYFEYRYSGLKRTNHIVQIKNTYFIDLILALANNGIIFSEIVRALTDEDIQKEQAEDFIDKLIKNQVIVSELEPQVTGSEFMQVIINKLENLQEISNIKKVLADVYDKLKKLDEKIGNPITKYTNLANVLEKLKVDYELKHLFQVDMSLDFENSTISKSTLRSINQGLIVLNKLTSKVKNENLNKFKTEFIKRYETQEISLLNVLDLEIGIGYARNSQFDGGVSPLVDKLILPKQKENSKSPNFDPVQSFLLSKLIETKANNLYEIRLKDKELTQFDVDWDDLPPTMSSIIKYIEKSSKEYPDGRILMTNAGNSSAVNLLGRFCHGNRKIHTFVNEIVRKENNYFKDVIVAEIVHLPESRVGNILQHPVLRNYEIPILAQSSINRENVIELEDLMVSIKDNRIHLRSKKFNKEVIPRLSNAHNYSLRTIPIYQFLCDLQTQNLRKGIGFNWGSLIENFSFTPRVVYNNLILSPATWYIKTENIHNIIKSKDNEKASIDKIKIWRKKLKLPKQVLFIEGDNELFIDLEKPLSIQTFLSIIKNKNNFTLKEFLFNQDLAIVKNMNDSFTNEFIFSFYKKNN